MMSEQNRFHPDYAVRPGLYLQEVLESREISQAELARRCGRTPKLISDIISGKNPVEPETAIQFERALGIDANIWLGMETDYRLLMARKREKEQLDQEVTWAKQFPVKELKDRGYIERDAEGADIVRSLVALFGVSSPETWRSKYDTLQVCYRHAAKHKSRTEALFTWLRLGELMADQCEANPYSETVFRDALRRIRNLTVHGPEVFEPEINRLCAEAGVIFVLVKPFKDSKLSGAARWLSSDRALIQQSLRHKTNDHFWFTFFHEAAHILLHSKKKVYADDERASDGEIEREANNFAADFLVPRKVFISFRYRQNYSKTEVAEFASSVGVHPGIIVGMLQHSGDLRWSHLNKLKLRLEFK